MPDLRRKLTKRERRIVCQVLDRLSEKFGPGYDGWTWENVLVEASECFQGVRFTYSTKHGHRSIKVKR